jgi:hypothetical protein
MLNPQVPDAGTCDSPFHITERPLNPVDKLSVILPCFRTQLPSNRFFNSLHKGTARHHCAPNDQRNVHAQHVNVPHHLSLLRKQASHVTWAAANCKTIIREVIRWSPVKSKAIPVPGRGGLQGCDMLRIPYCPDNLHKGGGKVVSPTHRPHFTPQKHYFFYVWPRDHRDGYWHHH